MKKNTKKKNNKSGFSLVELMVVVAIIAILAGVALPQMQLYQQNARRTEARTTLSSLSTSLGIWYSNNATYANTGLGGATGIGFSDPHNRFYNIGDGAAAADYYNCGGTACSISAPGGSPTAGIAAFLISATGKVGAASGAETLTLTDQNVKLPAALW